MDAFVSIVFLALIPRAFLEGFEHDFGFTFPNVNRVRKPEQNQADRVAIEFAINSMGLRGLKNVVEPLCQRLNVVGAVTPYNSTIKISVSSHMTYEETVEYPMPAIKASHILFLAECAVIEELYS